MKFNPCRCPECNALPKGTLDWTPSTALMSADDERARNPEFEYDGESKMHWDGQETEEDDQGRVGLICPNGHEWFALMDGAEPKPAPPADPVADVLAKVDWDLLSRQQLDVGGLYERLDKDVFNDDDRAPLEGILNFLAALLAAKGK
jgi:hypothetical protein